MKNESIITTPKITSYLLIFFFNIRGSINDENNDDVDNDITAMGTEILTASKKKIQCRATTTPTNKSLYILVIESSKISFL